MTNNEIRTALLLLGYRDSYCVDGRWFMAKGGNGIRYIPYVLTKCYQVHINNEYAGHWSAWQIERWLTNEENL